MPATTLRIQGEIQPATDFRQWVATPAVDDVAEGGSVIVSVVETTGGVPPDVPDSLTARFVTDSGSIIRTWVMDPALANQSETFFFTDTGFGGGAARHDIIEIKLQVTDGGVAPYDIETDGSPNSPPTAYDSVLTRGWMRGTTTVIESISNVALGGAKASPAEFDESLFVRLTLGSPSYVARALTVAVSNTTPALSAATNSTTSATRDVTFSGVCDDRFPAASTVVGVSVTAPNATLSGQPYTTFTTTTDDTITVDRRLPVVHHFQVDDEVFAVSKNDTSKQMLSNQTGLVASRFTRMRTGAGINGLSVTTTMDPTNPGTADTASSTTATRDGQLGWTDLSSVCSTGKPGGAWVKGLNITAPTDIDDDGFTNAAETITVLLADPRVTVVTAGGPTSRGVHSVPGIDFQAGLTLFQGGVRKILQVDSDGLGGFKAYVAVLRLQDTGANAGLAEYLEADGVTWTAATIGTIVHMHQLTQSRANAGVYVKTFPAAQTTSWGTYDVFTIGEAYFNGTPYSEKAKEIVVADNNAHDGYKPEMGGLLGLPGFK